MQNEFTVDDGRIEKSKEFIRPEVLYRELIERIRKYHPSDDISLVEKAYNMAAEAHKDQKRKSGEPYIIHPLSVALILANLEMDKETIVAGILHDVVEDTEMTEEQLAMEFTPGVALLVDGVTKLQHISSITDSAKGDSKESKDNDKLEAQAENLRKMFLAMAKDIRVIMIKLADRLHNMRTLKYMPAEKQQRIARETMDIYCPIAQRLGISKIKVELDDLSLKYLEPDVYYDLVDKIATRKVVREAYIQSIVDEVSVHINHAGIKAKIDGRVKHFFSIYKKMKNQDKTLDQIYDLFAVRIIVDTVKDCYAALGVIHEMYKPIPGRFKDYIAMPKANMYQSLHTTLIGRNGQPFEVQIRTQDMHRASEYGIAAHWKYKTASDGKTPDMAEEEKLIWLRQILEWQKDMSDNKEFMHLLKSDLDLFSDHVYCFTPTGEVKNLPAGSTPIDFAYAVHSAVGNKMIGAKVNGKLVTIDYEIKNGDRIEVLTSQNSRGPSRDWLNIVKSTQAKSKINQWFKHELKEENIIKGRELLLAYCKEKRYDSAALLKSPYTDRIQKKYGFSDWDSVLAAIGHGALKEGQILNKMKESYDQDHEVVMTNEEVLASVQASNSAVKMQAKSDSGIIVKGVDDVAVRFSKCCSPVPGDEIVGFVTRGRGITIHRTDCINVINMSEFDRERLIEAEWQDGSFDKQENYVAEITLFANDRNGLLVDITKVFTEKGHSIQALNTRTSKHGVVTMDIAFQIQGREALQNLVERLKNIESVIDITRATG